ncbi:AraC family transcriptional regulator [Phocaeicola coprophilus]|uniref:helix-turn-helix transcriptional regulator n=1 Tax=Phocaeicola coprophilus TaxID=387090 RepID=UPI003AB235FA
MKLKDSSRVILDLNPYNISIFGEIGCYHYDSVQPLLAEHVHSGMLEFCFLLKGCQSYCVGGEYYHLSGGDIFFTKPDEPHGTGIFPEEKGGLLYWMIIKSPESVQEYLGLEKQEAMLLFEQLSSLPQRLFRSSPLVERLLKRIFELAFQNTPFTAIEIRSTIILLFLELIRLGNSSDGKEYSVSVCRIIDYIDRHLKERIDLEYLADMMNLSLSRFKHRFKDEVGIPPAEFIMRRRIKYSESLLMKNMSIKDIAYDLGFSSPAHFSSVFKQYKGESPAAFKEKML